MINQKVRSSIRLKAHHLGMSEMEFLRRIRELNRQTELLLEDDVPTRKRGSVDREEQNKEPF